MKTLWYYIRTRNEAGKLLRDHFKTKSKKRAELYVKMFPESKIEKITEGTEDKKIPWTEASR